MSNRKVVSFPETPDDRSRPHSRANNRKAPPPSSLQTGSGRAAPTALEVVTAADVPPAVEGRPPRRPRSRSANSREAPSSLIYASLLKNASATALLEDSWRDDQMPPSKRKARPPSSRPPSSHKNARNRKQTPTEEDDRKPAATTTTEEDDRKPAATSTPNEEPRTTADEEPKQPAAARASTEDDEDFICPICHGPIVDPSGLVGPTGKPSCKHTFCLNCINTWSKKSLTPTCPYCKQEYESITMNVKRRNQHLVSDAIAAMFKELAPDGNWNQYIVRIPMSPQAWLTMRKRGNGDNPIEILTDEDEGDEEDNNEEDEDSG